jgi:hypothetical protein
LPLSLGVGVSLVKGSGVPAAAPSTLLDDIVAFWKVDEESGTRFDSVGDSDLTDNNTVTQAVGLLGSAGQFVAANLEHLNIVDNAALSMGAGVRFTFAAWVYPDTLGNSTILSKFGSEYLLDTTGVGTPRLFIGGSGLSYGSALTGSAWNLVIAWYDGAERGLQINNGLSTTEAYSTDVADGIAEFRLGSRADAPSSNFWDGRIDATGIWKRALTEGERDELWNDGAGVEWPF